MTRARDVANITDLPNAKGDLYTATAADTPTNLTVGSNGTFLVADSAQTAGIKWTTTSTLYQDSSGNLGIGGTPSNFGGVNLGVSNSTIGSVTVTDNTRTVYMYASSAGAFVGTRSNHPLSLKTNDTTCATFDTSGYLTRAALTAPKEKWTVSATAATGTIQYDCLTQGVLYYTTNSSGNFTLNFRGDSSTTLASLMNTGDAITVNFLATNSTAYYQNTAVTVDTSATVTVKWSGGTAPSAGNASAIDVYSYTIVKTGASAFTVLCAGPVKYA